MLNGQLYINGKDAYLTWGIFLDETALSTLMTPTMDNMAAAVKALVDNGYRGNCTVTIGGPPTTEGFAKEIGADHRDSDAQNCVKWLKEVM